MSTAPLWMVRAGRGGAYADDFLEDSFVALGFESAGTITRPVDKAALRERIQQANPDAAPGKVLSDASQLRRFYEELQTGDAVLTYNPSTRLYYLGTLTGEVSERDHALFRGRPVTWTQQVHRDTLTDNSKNRLGSISSLFQVSDDARADLEKQARALGDDTAPLPPTTKGDPTSDNDPSDAGDTAPESADDIETRAQDLIDDRIVRLGWEQLQELTAEILRAMGFRAQPSERGPDRGVDVTASPDGLGLTEPRIFVEVKHRPGTRIAAPDLRAFLGGRQAGDRCLYVSTGGFTKEARYEAERSNIPVTLIDLPRLRELVLEHYENFSVEGLKLVPLRRVYWVV